MSRRYLIVGNGAAGLSAAEAIRERDPSGEVTLLTDERHGFYSKPGLAYHLADLIPESQLFSRPDEEYRRLGLRRIHSRVEALDPRSHRILTSQRRPLEYDRLLLATGARAILPEAEWTRLDGVVTLDTLEDARRIVRRARRGRHAVVIGGGITALELAEGLAARGMETHYLLRRDRYWPGVLDGSESRVVEDRLRQEGIRLHMQSEIARVHGSRGRVAMVETSRGERLRADLLAVAIGIRPRTELARSAGLAVGQGIEVDGWMRTSDPDIYAAGDAAEIIDADTGARELNSLWWAALETGRLAGRNMAGDAAQYQRPIPFNVTRLGGLTTTIVGEVGLSARDDDLVSIARGDSEAWRHAGRTDAVEAGFEQARLRLHVGERHIQGAVLLGSHPISRPLQDLVRRRVDIRPIREVLLAAPPILPEVITRYWQSCVEAGSDAS